MNIYVGNLPFDASTQDLEGLFAEFGEVQSAAVITDRTTGRSRGFGFVEMPDDAATKAIGQLDGSEYGGRRLTVNQARPRPQR